MFDLLDDVFDFWATEACTIWTFNGAAFRKTNILIADFGCSRAALPTKKMESFHSHKIYPPWN